MLIFVRSVALGFAGYDADSVCRNVQEARPRVSIEGGQSVGGVEGMLVERFLVVLVKEAKELQERQGFPSFPNITPFGYFFGGASEVLEVVVIGALSFKSFRVSSAILSFCCE